MCGRFHLTFLPDGEESGLLTKLTQENQPKWICSDFMHFIREYRQRKIKDEKDFQVFTASSIKYRFRDEIEIFECPEAAQRILEHPKCPFTEFAFVGECEIDLRWYYIAANGPIHELMTQIILLEK